MRYRSIAVEGIIGAGKTTLTKKLAQALHFKQALEVFEESNNLKRFYAGEEVDLLQLEKEMLDARVHALDNVNWNQNNVVADFWLDKSILFAELNLKEDQKNQFQEYLDAKTDPISDPDLIVYIDIPVEKALLNIKKRNRDMERSISPNYLNYLHKAYHTIIKNTSIEKVILDYNQVDIFNAADFNSILKRILDN